MNKYYTLKIQYHRFKLQSSGKIVHNTTERSTRIQSFPNITSAVNQDPVNIISAKPKLLAARVEKYGHPEFRLKQ